MQSNNAESFLRNDAKGQGKWLVADYEAGDVVFHDPYTIHGSSKNSDAKGRIRLSTDLRFYEKGSDIDKRWMKLDARRWAMIVFRIGRDNKDLI